MVANANVRNKIFAKDRNSHAIWYTRYSFKIRNLSTSSRYFLESKGFS